MFTANSDTIISMQLPSLPVSSQTARRMTRSAGIISLVSFGAGIIGALSTHLGLVAILGCLTCFLFPGLTLTLGAGKMEENSSPWYHPVISGLAFSAILSATFAWLAPGSWAALAWIFYAITLLPLQRYRKNNNSSGIGKTAIIIVSSAGVILLITLLLAR